jgi:hypothetical protein
MGKILTAAILLFILIVIFGSGCKKNTFETDSTYSEEMINYIDNDIDGRDLFSKNIFSDSSFVPNDTLLGNSEIRCYYKYDSIVRNITVTIADQPSDIYPFEYVYDALARVIDVGYGHVYKINGPDLIPSYKLIDSLTRYAYFVKLYNDSYIYRGWRLFGYIQGPYIPYLDPGKEKLIAGTNISLAANPPIGVPPNVASTDPHNRNYIMDDSIPKFPLNDSLTLYSDLNDIIFTEVNSEKVGALNTILNQSKYKTGWRITAVSDKLYHLVRFNLAGKFAIKFISGKADTTYLKSIDYVIPYKADI